MQNNVTASLEFHIRLNTCT